MNKKSKKDKMVIKTRGGVVQGVLSTSKKIKVEIIDYDDLQDVESKLKSKESDLDYLDLTQIY